MIVNFCSPSYFFNASQKYPFLVYDFREDISDNFKNTLHCPYLGQLQSTQELDSFIKYPDHITEKKLLKNQFKNRKRSFNFFVFFTSTDVFSLYLSEKIRLHCANKNGQFQVKMDVLQEWCTSFQKRFQRQEIVHAKTGPHENNYFMEDEQRSLVSTRKILELEYDPLIYQDTHLQRRSSAPHKQQSQREYSIFSNLDYFEMGLQVYQQFWNEKFHSIYILVEPMNIILKNYPYLNYSVGKNKLYLNKPFPNEIIENKLYLGGAEHAKEVQILEEQLKITHIVNATIEVQNYSNNIDYLNIRIYDEPQVQIKEYFEEVYKYIDKAITNQGKVLVHCAQGKSRSACLVVMYLMRKFVWSFEEAYEFVQERRDVVCINDGFINQLMQFKS